MTRLLILLALALGFASVPSALPSTGPEHAVDRAEHCAAEATSLSSDSCPANQSQDQAPCCSTGSTTTTAAPSPTAAPAQAAEGRARIVPMTKAVPESHARPVPLRPPIF